jgi:hypothetical protein
MAVIIPLALGRLKRVSGLLCLSQHQLKQPPSSPKFLASPRTAWPVFRIVWRLSPNLPAYSSTILELAVTCEMDTILGGSVETREIAHLERVLCPTDASGVPDSRRLKPLLRVFYNGAA